MATVAEKFLEAVEQYPGETDRFYTDLLFDRSRHPSQVNQEGRLLAGRGLVQRKMREDGRLGTYPVVPPNGNAKPLVEARIDPRLLPFLDALSELFADAVVRKLDAARCSGDVEIQ